MLNYNFGVFLEVTTAAGSLLTVKRVVELSAKKCLQEVPPSGTKRSCVVAKMEDILKFFISVTYAIVSGEEDFSDKKADNALLMRCIMYEQMAFGEVKLHDVNA